MKNVFWLRPQIAGRPGPDWEMWNAEELAQGGIGAILSVNNGELVNEAELAEHGIQYLCVPLSNEAPPKPGDFEICAKALPKSFRFVQGQIAHGKKVLVHCYAGKDRTGMFLSYYLCMSEGLTPVEAVEEVKRVRSIALSAEGLNSLTLSLLNSICVWN